MSWLNSIFGIVATKTTEIPETYTQKPEPKKQGEKEYETLDETIQKWKIDRIRTSSGLDSTTKTVK
jgi:hypothetical protein